MSIKQKIHEDFISAMKAKDDNAKAALSGIKAAITNAEKAEGVVDLSDDDVIKVITKAIKQREESINMYELACRDELARKERDEMRVLRAYMPERLTEQEIGDALKEIITNLSATITNPTALQGKTIGEFNKKYNGRADIKDVKEILSKLVG